MYCRWLLQGSPESNSSRGHVKLGVRSWDQCWTATTQTVIYFDLQSIQNIFLFTTSICLIHTLLLILMLNFVQMCLHYYCLGHWSLAHVWHQHTGVNWFDIGKGNQSKQLHQIFAGDSIYAIARICYRPCVCLSVRGVYHRKMLEFRTMKFSPYDSPIRLVFAG